MKIKRLILTIIMIISGTIFALCFMVDDWESVKGFIRWLMIMFTSGAVLVICCCLKAMCYDKNDN